MRYLRLYWYFLRFALSRAMQFRFDFWFRIIMDAWYYVIAIVTYRTLYLHTDSLGGFNFHQAMVFIGAAMVIDAIQMTFYSNGVWWIPSYINKGDMDYYLVRPISALYFLSLRDFAVASFFNLLMACGVLTWALHAYPDPIPAWKLGYGCLLIVNGSFLFYIMRVMFIIPAFWSASGEGLHHVFFYIREALERPDGIYFGIVRKVLVTVLPFALMASFPTRAFFEDFNFERLLHITAVTVGLYGVLLWCWHRGLRAYSSASS